MRQLMLMESLDQCRGGMVSLGAQVEKMAGGTCQQCVPSVASACRAQAEQASLGLQRGLVELRQEEAARERRLNATVQTLLHSRHRGERPAEAGRTRAEVTERQKPGPDTNRHQDREVWGQFSSRLA